jgi:hypothetical protein
LRLRARAGCHDGIRLAAVFPRYGGRLHASPAYALFLPGVCPTGTITIIAIIAIIGGYYLL